MGDYFNTDNSRFVTDLRSPIYVDKTGLLTELNIFIGTNKNCFAVSHARRFGKSHAADMIEAYYSRGCDSKGLFSRLAIGNSDSFETHINKYNTIRLDVSGLVDSAEDDISEKITQLLKHDFRKEYTDIDYDLPLATIMLEISRRSGAKFIIIIDEWDAFIREYPGSTEQIKKYMKLLHTFFKGMEAKSFLGLGYITGILPIEKMDGESAVNNFREFTMIDSRKLTRYYGFTEEEVKSLCEKYGVNLDDIKNWYDGYYINGLHMYNPNSVSSAIIEEDLHSYWKDSSAFENINRYISLNLEGLRDTIIRILAGEPEKVNISSFDGLDNIKTKDNALTALIHLGYLGCEKITDTLVRAFVPNLEVRMAFSAALEVGPWKDVASLITKCEDLLDCTLNADEERVAHYISLAHEAYTSILNYNDENSLSCVIAMAYYTVQIYYNVIREFPSGKGFADLAFIPKPDIDKPAMIVELKWDKSADSAINQIKEKRYTSNLSGYKEIILVGISYDKDTKKHTCKIEKWVDVHE